MIHNINKIDLSIFIMIQNINKINLSILDNDSK